MEGSEENMPKIKASSPNPMAEIMLFYSTAEKLGYALAVAYAAKALVYFQSVQRDLGKGALGEFWTNRTNIAASKWIAKAFRTPTSYGFYVAHSNDVKYGKYLEYYNDERFASLKPIMAIFVPPFLAELRKIYGRDFHYDITHGV